MTLLSGRPSGELTALRKKFTTYVILGVGLLVILIGAGIAGFEFYHRIRYAANAGGHVFEWQPFAWAVAFIWGGALLIQTGNVKESLDTMRHAIPFFRQARAGGQRVTDPKGEPPPPEA